MFRITNEAKRVRVLTAMHIDAINERLEDDAQPYGECFPACQARDPFVCTCGTYEATNTPLETIPADGYCDYAGEVYCGACGEMATCIAPDSDDPRCFDCLDQVVTHEAWHCLDLAIATDTATGAIVDFCYQCDDFVDRIDGAIVGIDAGECQHQH